jgi:hypothetical protein
LFLERYNPLMPHIDKHKTGSFGWIELGTSDQNGAKQFYGSLLGWNFEDHSMGPQGVYTMFKLDGKDLGGCYAVSMMPGVPPHWGIFISVEDVDRASARAGELGGKIVRPAFDVGPYGRMAVIQDPAGAHLSAWQPKTHMGMGITGENGAFCWADLLAEDPGRVKTFYEGVFGWSLEPGKDASGYIHIKNGGDYIGGMREKPPQAPPHWMIYFQTADCGASTAKAKELGAKIYVEPMDIPGAGRFAVLDDPQGAGFALFQPQH